MYLPTAVNYLGSSNLILNQNDPKKYLESRNNCDYLLKETLSKQQLGLVVMSPPYLPVDIQVTKQL